jgi:cytoskeleton protein RodZ
MDTGMNEEVSSKLKARRQELGYSVEEVVEKTKLYPSVIRDLEEGNLSNINSAYLKGFIRIYASFLGLNAAELTNNISVQYTGPKEEKKSKRTNSL